MAEENQTSNDTLAADNPVPAIPGVKDSDAVVQPDLPEEKPKAPVKDLAVTMAEVADKIADSHNILIALSGDPSVDEMASAIGLSMFLDRLGKRATAIYSGKTPDALRFLEPEGTFEDNPDTLQDFVIALNKDKADHLRYKLDGDYVKIYITPYKTKIAADNLEFSYGDYNVDLVIALNVPNGVDLDSALREYGRIMHDATVINITTGKPGKFGEIEWSNTKASSVSEMIADLLLNLGNKIKLEPKEATAFLTGIVAATDRFSRTNTMPMTLRVASRLMEAGANQQLISENITDELDNRFFSFSMAGSDNGEGAGAEAFSIEHKGEGEPGIGEVKKDNESKDEGPKGEGAKAEEPEESEGPKIGELKELGATEESDEAKPSTKTDDAAVAADAMLDELKASLADAGAETVPEKTEQPVSLDNLDAVGQNEAAGDGEKVLTPSTDFAAEDNDGPDKYSKMLEDALAEPDITEQPEAVPAESVPTEGAPIESAPAEDASVENTPVESTPVESMPATDAPAENPTVTAAPEVATEPEVNGVPEINYGPLPGDQVLPPPPAPPIDLDAAMPGNETAAEPEAVPTAAPEIKPDDAAGDAGAFQIPTLE